jgi:hypothetical protein
MKLPELRTVRMLTAFAVFVAVIVGHGVLGASADSVHYAGLVVRYGDGQMAYAYIGFSEDEINGIELLKRSGLDVVTVAFGGLGEGVCSIDEHGCPSTECRKRVCQGPSRDDPFWQYFRQSSPGQGDWQAMALGGSSTKVHDSDVDGWSWTGAAPELPPLSLADVAQLAGFDGTSFDGSGTPGTGAVLSREGSVAIDDGGQGLAGYMLAAGLILGGLTAALWRPMSHRRAKPVR